MKLRGLNLGEKEVKLVRLSSWPNIWGDNINSKEFLKWIEEQYLNAYKECKNIKINHMDKSEGKVNIQPGMINHMCSSNIDSLKSISKRGILASEWFGQLESEFEGIFCAFVDRIHEEDSVNGRIENMKTMMGKEDNSCVTLFFDSENPVMKKLIHLDYFEYEKNKQQKPEKLVDMYTEKEINVFDNIIEPHSKSGARFHTRGRIPECDWSAIPGGIPPQLVNGICIGRGKYDKEYIEEISQLFPDATIFDYERNIIKEPVKEYNKNTEKTKEKYVKPEINFLEETKQIAIDRKMRDVKDVIAEIRSNVQKRDNIQDKDTHSTDDANPGGDENR